MKNLFLFVQLLFVSISMSGQTFQEKLQTALNNSFAGSGLPGVSVAVSTPDKGMVYASAGIGNVYTNSTIIPETTKYRIASATKNMVAVLIMRLQEAGYFSIDDKLSQHLTIPGLPNGSTITIRQLLQHSAGVGDYLNNSNDFINAAVPNKIFSNDEIIGYINNLGASFTPDTKYEYSNGGFFVLGMLIEKKLGKTIDVAMQEWLFSAMKLDNTFVDLTSTTTNKISDLAEGTRAYNYSPTSVKAAGAIVSTAENMAKFCKAAFGGGYLTSSSINAMITPSAFNSAYGLGTRLYISSKGVNYHGHTGTILGYNSFMYYIPSMNVSVGIVTNAYASPSTLWTNIRNAIYTVVENEYINYCATNNCNDSNIPIPTAPTANQLYVNTPVNFTWNSGVQNAEYRIQVSKSNTGWTDANGFTSATTPNSTIVVNQTTNSTNLTWDQINTQIAEQPQGGTTYYYTIRSFSQATGTSKYSSPIAFTPKSNNCNIPTTTSVMVDNTSATLIGSWTETNATAGYEGNNYIHDNNTNKGNSSVTYTPSLPVAGNYEVFVKHTSGSNRANNVPIDVIHETGTTSNTVNQQQNNGVWISLGKYNFTGTNNDKVIIKTTGTSGVVIADAVRFVFINCSSATLSTNDFENIANSSEIFVYPNPTSGMVTISRTSDITSTLSVINVLGQEVKTEILNSKEQEINLSNLSNGMYFLNFTSNKERITKKIIIQK